MTTDQPTTWKSRIKLERVYCFAPCTTEDTNQLLWLRYAWRITNDNWEYYMGLTPVEEYYEFRPTEWGHWKFDINGNLTDEVVGGTPTVPDTPPLPKINIRCETKSSGIIGTTYLDVVRVEQEDDGSYTAVTDFWPRDN